MKSGGGWCGDRRQGRQGADHDRQRDAVERRHPRRRHGADALTAGVRLPCCRTPPGGRMCVHDRSDLLALPPGSSFVLRGVGHGERMDRHGRSRDAAAASELARAARRGRARRPRRAFDALRPHLGQALRHLPAAARQRGRSRRTCCRKSMSRCGARRRGSMPARRAPITWLAVDRAQQGDRPAAAGERLRRRAIDAAADVADDGPLGVRRASSRRRTRRGSPLPRRAGGAGRAR